MRLLLRNFEIPDDNPLKHNTPQTMIGKTGVFLKSRQDLRYDAAIEILDSRHQQLPFERGCFRLPVRDIRETAKLSSGQVRGLIAEGAQSCAMLEPSRLEVPWVDFLAIGMAPKAVGNAVWLALATSVPEKIETAVMADVDASVQECSAEATDRRRNFDLVANEVKKYSDVAEQRSALIDSDGGYTESILSNASRRHRERPSEGHQKNSNKLAPGVLVFCAAEDLDAVMAFFKSSEKLVPLAVPTLEGFLRTTLTDLRISMGLGWFPTVDRFALAVSMRLKNSSLPKMIVLGDPKQDKCSPTELVAAAFGKIAGFGWSLERKETVHRSSSKRLEITKPEAAVEPQTGVQTEVKVKAAGKNEAKGRGVKSRVRARSRGNRWSDGDLRVFHLPSVLIPGEGVLKVKTVEDRLQATWLNFESSFPQDRVLVAVEFVGYGSTGSRENALEAESISSPKLRLLPPLHVSVVGVLRRFIPGCEIQMLGYTAGASATTRSGIIERLVKLHLTHPEDSGAATRLVRLITKFHRPTRVKIPRKSPLDECLEIETKLASLESGNAGGQPPKKGRSPSCLDSLFRRGLTGRGSFRQGLLLSGAVLEVIARIRRSKILKLINTPAKTAEGQYTDVLDLVEEIASEFQNPSGANWPRGSRKRDLPIYKELGLFFVHLCHGQVALPEILHSWVSSRLRIIFIAPLDDVEPHPERIQKYKRRCVGHFQSHRIYPALFSGQSDEFSVAVDLQPLLAMVSHTLDMGDTGRKHGWLTHKISETNELMTALMREIGHVPDFSLATLPFDFAKKKDLELILDRLDSRLIVRCIMESEGGVTFLKEMCDKIDNEIRQRGIGSRPSGETHYPSNYERLDQFLTILQDYTGIAGAALDFCRSYHRTNLKNPSATDSGSFVVYFRPDRLRMVFRTRNTDISRDVRERTEQHDAITPDNPYVADPFAKLDHHLERLLLSKDFDVDKAAAILRHLQEAEGMGKEGELENQLVDQERDISLKHGYNPIVSKNCQLLRTHIRGISSP